MLLVLASKLCLSQKSDESNWIRVGVATNGNINSEWFFSNTTTSVNGKSFKVWVMTKDNRTVYNGKTYLNVKKMKLFEVDCADNKTKVLSAACYDSDGSLIFSDNYTYTAQWEYSTPETIGDSFVKKACEHFKR